MKKTMLIIGFIASIVGIILSLTSYSNYAFIPCIAALVFGLIAFSEDQHLPYPKKSVQIIFIITIIALSLATYNALYGGVEATDQEVVNPLE